MAPAVAAETPVEIVESWIAQADGFDWLEISHAGVEHDASTGVTTVSDLAITFEMSDLPGVGDSDAGTDAVDVSYGFHFPSLVFEGLGIDDGYYHADAIRSDELRIDFVLESAVQGSATTTGSYDGISATNLRWARLPEIDDDPSRPISRFYPLAAALVDVSFDGMEFGALEMLSENLEPRMTTTIRYGAGTVGATERGNISSMSIDGISASGTAAPGAEDGAVSFEMTVGEVQARQYNYGDMIRLFDPEQTPGTGDEPFETVSGWFSATDWTVSAEGVAFSMDGLRMEDLGGRRPVLPILTRADELFIAATENGAEPDPIELVELAAAVYGAFRLGLVEMHGLQFEMDEYWGRIGSAGTAGLSVDGIDSIYYRGLEAGDEAGDIKFRLGDLTVSDLGFPSLAALIALGENPETDDAETILAAMPRLGGVSISDLLVEIPFLAELSLAASSLEMSGHIGPIPTRIRSLVDSLRMPTWMLDDDSFELLDGLGYEDIDLSQEIDLAWGEADETLSVNASATLGEGGSLFLNAILGGLPRDIFEDPMSAPFVAFMMTLNEASLRFVDDSLTERVLTMLGEQEGIDAQTMRAQAIGIIPFALAALQRPDFLMQVTAAAGAFLENPGTIRIDLRPDEPVPLMDLIEASETDPGLVIDLLNAEVSGE